MGAARHTWLFLKGLVKPIVKTKKWYEELGDMASVYGLWLIAVALSIFVLIAARGAINILFISTVGNRWVLRLVDRLTLIIMGIGWLAGVIAIESYFRQGQQKGLLLKRFGKLVVSEALLYGVMSLVQTLSPQLLLS